MKAVTAVLLVLLYASIPAAASAAVKRQEAPLPDKIMQANTVYVDCVCPRALAAAKPHALQQLQSWGRFQIVESLREADLVILFAGNPYLGDLLTRDGPDKRPVFIKDTIMTVIDAHTGAALWSDSRQWGSWRVGAAASDLVVEFKTLMTAQVRNWSLNDLMMCGVTPLYKEFEHLTPQEAMQSDGSIARIADKPNRLRVASPLAPDFCKTVELVVGDDNKIMGFEVFATRSGDLNINEVLQRADLFDFTGGKYSNGDRVFFSAQEKNKKMLIQFQVQGHRSVLSSVTYYY